MYRNEGHHSRYQLKIGPELYECCLVNYFVRLIADGVVWVFICSNLKAQLEILQYEKPILLSNLWRCVYHDDFSSDAYERPVHCAVFFRRYRTDHTIQ